MIRYNGNSILVVGTDEAYALQMREVLEERGAIVRYCITLVQAKKNLSKSDFDMIICSKSLNDGSARDLINWCKDNLSNIPIFSALGEYTQLEKKQLQNIGVKNFFSRNNASNLLDDISRALFNFDEFKKNLLESHYEKGISYELKVGGKKIIVKAQNIMDRGVFLSFEAPLSVGFPATLFLNFADVLNLQSISLRGDLQGEFAGGQYFQVSKEDMKQWENLLSHLCKKQDDVTEFLKKASGR